MLIRKDFCFTLNCPKDVFLFSILKLFTLFCKERTLLNRWFSPDFTFSLWTPLILEEIYHSSFVFFAAQSSGFQLFFFITFQNILLNSSSTPRYPCSFFVLFGRKRSLDFPSFGHFILTCPGWHFQQWPRRMTICIIKILFAVRQSGLSSALTVSPYVLFSVTLITVIQCVDCVIKILHRPLCLDLWCCECSDIHIIS